MIRNAMRYSQDGRPAEAVGARRRSAVLNYRTVSFWLSALEWR